MTSWSPKFTWDKKLFSCANSRSSKNFILFVSLYQITVRYNQLDMNVSFKTVSAELLLCALLYFSLDDGISRASLLLLVVARWCISCSTRLRRFFYRVVCENNNEDKCLLSLAQQTNTNSDFKNYDVAAFLLFLGVHS